MKKALLIRNSQLLERTLGQDSLPRVEVEAAWTTTGQIVDAAVDAVQETVVVDTTGMSGGDSAAGYKVA